MSKQFTITLHRNGSLTGWCGALRSNGLGILADVQGGCPIYVGRNCAECPAARAVSCGSRYVKGKINLKHMQSILDTCEELFGKQFFYADDNSVEATGYGSQRTMASVVVPKNICGSTYGDLAFVKSDKGYDMVIDDMGYNGIARKLGWDGVGNLDEFEGMFSQRYAMNHITNQLPTGVTIEDVSYTDSGEIQITCNAQQDNGGWY